MPALGTLGFEWHRKRACASGGQGRHSRPATAQDSAASGDCEGALRGPAAAAGLLTGTPKAEHSRAQARRSPILPRDVQCGVALCRVSRH